MKNHNTLTTILLLCLIVFPACDMIFGPKSTEKVSGDLHVRIIFYMVNPGYYTWRDEVQLFRDGKVTIKRLEGEAIPASSRVLSTAELEYIKSRLARFTELGNEYLDDAYKNYSRYTIDVYDGGTLKTVTCDNSIYDYRNWNSPQYTILRPLVSAFSDVRMSLIGEGRFSGKLDFDLRPEKLTVGLDEEIVLTYRVKNKTNQDITLVFPNVQQLGYTIYHKGRVISEFPWVVSPAFSSWQIPAASEAVEKAGWSQRIVHDEYEYSDRKAKSGTYTIVQYLLGGNSPYRSTDITITEQGAEPLQTRAIKSILRPQELLYEMNNRVSREYVFTFTTARPVGYKITSLATGNVVRADSSTAPGSAQITIPPYGDYVFSEPWNGADSAGNLLPKGGYRLEMWLIGQNPDYRAVRRFIVY